MIVPYKEGMDILEKLETAQTVSDKKRLLRKIQRYTVSVYENKLKRMLTKWSDRRKQVFTRRICS